MNYYGLTLTDPAVIQEVLVSQVQLALDTGARDLGYDDIKTAVTYRGDPNPRFASEADALFLWRSACWTTAYAYLAEVQAGTKPLPSLEDLAGLLPPFPSLEASP